MEEELNYINESTRRFQYVLPAPIIPENDTYMRNVYLYTPNKIIRNFYSTYSTNISPVHRKLILRHLKEEKSTVITRGLQAYSAFTGIRVFKALKIHRKMFHECKFIREPIAMPKILIDPIKVKKYNHYFGKNYQFMTWIADWVEKQEIGGEVYLKNNSYYPKVKGYLIGEGYEELSENVMVRKQGTISDKYYLI